jgi:dTDP-4-amino-4,6-dideoxygalactose transaminase
MIPRTKVNYSLIDLARSCFAGTRRHRFTNHLTHKLSRIFGEPHVLLTASGRGGLYLLLRALPQSTVVVPAYTCKAVVEAVKLARKQIVYVDVEPDGFNMDPRSLAPLLSDDAIVLATHQFGIPCDIETIVRLCEENGAFLVEDAAASMGSRVGRQLTGTFGGAAFFSFDSTKLLTVPLKGGFLTVKDAVVFDQIREVHAQITRSMPWWAHLKLLCLATALILLENHLIYRLFHTVVFRWRNRFTEDSTELDLRLSALYRYRLAEWQAWLATRQLDRFDEIVQVRRRLYAEYHRRLQGSKSFVLPPEDRKKEWACVRFPIRVAGDKLLFYRSAVEKGIDFAFSFTFIVCPLEFERAHRLAASVLDLPFYYKLSEKELDKVISVLRELDSKGLAQ